MARGEPDGKISNLTYASQTSDPALTYQMLWGFSPVDSQGRVIFLDTFNNGMMSFRGEASGAGANPAIYSGTSLLIQVFTAPSSVEVKPGTVSGDLSQIGKGFYLGYNTRLGVEAALLIDDTVLKTPIYNVELRYKYNDGLQKGIKLRFNRSAKTWQILTFGGSYQTIFTMSDIYSQYSPYIQVKVVGDFKTGKYVRALIGDNLIDISNYDLPGVSWNYNNFVAVIIGGESFGAGSGNGYIGYVLITKDEQ